MVQKTYSAKPSEVEAKWYVIHTYSGYENKVKSNLEKRIEYMNMADKIFRIEVPQKTVTKMKDGKKIEREEALRQKAMHKHKQKKKRMNTGESKNDTSPK